MLNKLKLFLNLYTVNDLYKKYREGFDYGVGFNKYKDVKTVYLASPYSNRDPLIMNKREIDVTKAAAQLTEQYKISLFLPITQSAAMARYNKNLKSNFDFWKDIDLNEVALRDELWVLMLPGWNKSIGVLEEIKHADKLNKTIRYIYPKTLRFKKD